MRFLYVIKLLFTSPTIFVRKLKIRIGLPNSNIKKIIKHNAKVWSGYKNPNAESVILFDYYPLSETELARSYLLNILAKKFNAKIVSYSTNKKIRTRIWDKIYRSYNVESHLDFKLTRQQKKRSHSIYEKVIPTIRTKQNLFDLHVCNVWIGVDVYEEYLMRYTKPTVDITDVRSLIILKEAVDILVFFIDYFKNNNVKAIDSSHIGVRLNSNLIPKIAGRLFNIPYYTAHARSIVHYPEPHLQYKEEGRRFSNYHKYFIKLPEKEQSDGIAYAKERMERRFSGEVGVDMMYSTKSAFSTAENPTSVVKISNRIKVLVCTHEFYDSPNCYGGLLFMDFYEWLLYLVDISVKTDYDWYIKTHPDVIPLSEKIIKEFSKSNPNFTIIPKNTSFHQLAKDGISHVLTCYGTVGQECPLLGMSVINAGNNPHMGYNFNYHPKSLEEYESLLLNLSIVNKKINVNDIYEFYYMHHSKMGIISDDWFFASYEKMLSDLTESERIEFEIFPYFLKTLTPEKHQKIISTMQGYINSQRVGVAIKETIL